MIVLTATKPAQIYSPKYSTIDHNNSEMFKYSILEKIIDSENLTLILDLSNVKEMYSSGIGVLIFLESYLKDSNGKLKLAGLDKNLLTRFETRGLHNIFEIYETIDAAQQSH